jgi:hypothetical protein
LTFTPPGMFGHVASGVGIDYDPAQAHTWMTSAGYASNGAGLTVNLWYNTSPGLQNLTMALRSSWLSVFPQMTVNVYSEPWSDYLRDLANGSFPIWRNGWCLDYADGFNFVNDAVQSYTSGGSDGYGAYGSYWNRSGYLSLMDQAARAFDAATRADLYRQAEQLLVQDEAVVLPIYTYTAPLLVKPYLIRPLGISAGYLPDWSINRLATDAIPDPTIQADFTTPADQISYSFPANTFDQAVTLSHTVLPVVILPDYNHLLSQSAFRAFDIEAVALVPGKPAVNPLNSYMLQVTYTDVELKTQRVLKESSLAFYSWDGATWVREPTSSVNMATNTITAHPDHFGQWVVMGVAHPLMLPFVSRK